MNGPRGVILILTAACISVFRHDMQAAVIVIFTQLKTILVNPFGMPFIHRHMVFLGISDRN